jgi:hypothetical protein
VRWKRPFRGRKRLKVTELEVRKSEGIEEKLRVKLAAVDVSVSERWEIEEEIF